MIERNANWLVPPAPPLCGDVFDDLMSGALCLAPDDAHEPPLTVGPWAIRAQIGHGGVSLVYDAERLVPGGVERAALKLARRAGPETAWLFRHEARLLDRLRPPTVIGVLDTGVDAYGRPYIAMEMCDGQRVTDRARGLDPHRRLELAGQVCRAVAEIHDEGIVHADLKPDHLLVRDDGAITVLDFGLSRDLNTPIAPVAGLQLGITPEFASPEQVLGGPVGFQTDVFALGLVVHEIMAERRQHMPWGIGGAGSALGFAGTLVTVGAAPPEPTVDTGLVAVLQTAVHPNVSQRFHTARAFADALESVLGPPCAVRA